LTGVAAIPFCRQPVLEEARLSVLEALAAGALAGNGQQTRGCHQLLAELAPGARPFLTNSCTAALEMGVLIAGLSEGDEVIIPSWTFPSTANAIALRGAVPVFVDVDEATLNMTPAAVEAAITSRTRAVMCVHYAGVACDMDGLRAVCQAFGLLLIEDAAQAVGSAWKGEPLGGIGDMGAYSFHGTKNISCGEGGALMVKNAKFIEAAEVAWEKGTNRLSFLRGEVSKYEWCALGSSFLPSEMTAALLAGQLRHADIFNGQRRMAWDYYMQLLTHVSSDELTLPFVPAGAEHNGHIFAVRTRSGAVRDDAMNRLVAAGIDARTHYEPLHCAPAGLRYGRLAAAAPVTEAAARTIIRLPIDSVISRAEQEQVVDTLTQVLRMAA